MTIPIEDSGAPAPGIYASVPFEEYCSWKAVNHSLLDRGLQSWAHVHEEMAHPSDEQTEAQAFGHAFHAALLEPERYSRMRITAPINQKTSASYGWGTKAYNEALAEYAGHIVVRFEDEVAINAMVASVMAHPAAGRLCAAPGPREVCAVWTDDRTRLKCKGRLDLFVAGKFRLDIKTCMSAAKKPFEAAAFRYGYHRQEAFYREGFAVAPGGSRCPGIIIAVEKSPPYPVAVYTMSDDYLLTARRENQLLLDGFDACQKENVWPGYPQEVQTLDAPPWAYRDGEDNQG